MHARPFTPYTLLTLQIFGQRFQIVLRVLQLRRPAPQPFHPVSQGERALFPQCHSPAPQQMRKA